MPADHLPSPRPAALIAGILPPVVAADESMTDAPKAMAGTPLSVEQEIQ